MAYYMYALDYFSGYISLANEINFAIFSRDALSSGSMSFWQDLFRIYFFPSFLVDVKSLDMH